MSQDRLDIEQRDAQELASGYSRWYRAVELFSIVSFFTLTGLLLLKLYPSSKTMPWLVVAAVAVGFLLADFTSGFVHWMADTWGSVELPLLGKALLRPFREHHVDPKAMTRHDYIETNGSNCLISLPWAVGALCIPYDVEGWEAAGVFWSGAIGSMIFWVMMTNQIHKWSHFEQRELPAVIRWAQRLHLILPPAHHDVHHTPPFDRYYCITTGWLNWPLTKLQFFKTLERIITATTGVVPRKDDIGLKAALAVAPLKPGEKSPQVQIDLPRS